MPLRSVLVRPVPAAAATALVVLPAIVAMTAVWTGGADPRPVDYGRFGPAGEALLTGRWSSIYDDAATQAGPFELAPYGLLHLLGVSGAPLWTVAFTICGAATAFLAALVLRPTLRPDPRSSLLAAGGVLLLVLAGPVSASWTLGHPAEVLVPLLWVVAGRLALRGRPVAAAVLVAASSGFEVWGVLGAPVVLLAADIRVVRSAIAGAMALAVLWLPFVLAGPFAMFAFRWPVADVSLLHLVDPAATAFPWSLRLLQSALAVGAATAVALLTRRRCGAWGQWAVPVAVVSGRLVLDPVLAPYYWSPVLIGAVGALLLAARRRDLPAAAGGAAALVLGSDLGAPVLRAAVLVALTLAGAALAGRRERRTTPAPAPSRTVRA